jgi:hypothetical protein
VGDVVAWPPARDRIIPANALAAVDTGRYLGGTRRKPIFTRAVT